MNIVLYGLYQKLKELLALSDYVFADNAPALLKEAYAKQGFLDNLPRKRPTDNYTRTKIIGDGPNQLVARLMEWPKGFRLPPHSHHGRPCVEIIIEGELEIINYKIQNNLSLIPMQTYEVRAGDTAIADPRITEIHSIQTFMPSASLHFYPLDASTTTIYLKNGNGKYVPKTISLQQD